MAKLLAPPRLFLLVIIQDESSAQTPLGGWACWGDGQTLQGDHQGGHRGTGTKKRRSAGRTQLEEVKQYASC